MSDQGQRGGNAAAVMARLERDGVVNLDAIRELGGGELAAEVRRTGQVSEAQLAQLGGPDVLPQIVGADALQRLQDNGVVSLDRPAREIIETRQGRGAGTIEQQRISILIHGWYVFIEFSVQF